MDLKDQLEDLEQWAIEVILHNKQGFKESLARFMLHGLSWIYAGAVQLRIKLYRERYIRDHHVGVPVISIGNLTVGGTGKTPVAELLARALQKEGRNVAILSRGYKSKRQRRVRFWTKWLARIRGEELPQNPPRVVSNGERVLLDSHTAGDEPFMLASNLPGVPVVVDKDRVKAGLYAIRQFNSDVLLLDDGLQYVRLKHRLDMVLIDRTAPWGNGFLLPRGTLREPPRHLKRASYIFLTKCDSSDNTEIIRELRKYNRVAEIIECRHRPKYLENIHTRERVSLEKIYGAHVGAVSGIAVPESFESGLRKLGAKVDVTLRFADHHRFTLKDIRNFIDRCERRDVEMIVTTEKDFVRFPEIRNPEVPIYFLRVEIEIVNGREIFDRMVRILCEPREVPRPVYGSELAGLPLEQ
ncbi:tetraacyldisaccharide 4'-kinase [Verrucomicrobium spinosum]|uniref:tetraacyldisaccharide 4'-kinase n=1 Tax=Verrucomicrobium spinosum TaxID=2736 RepID=UPI0001744606|nr:tetraacyldisaccharide 4'-kinase [Verrucomicrobium spinosum]